MAFNDPLSPFQWYLNATGSVAAAAGQKDLGNLDAVWADYIGRNIKIGIYDSGVDVSHPDLAGNYLASLNPTINGGQLNPKPTTGAGDKADAHGTAVAGIIAGIANNNTGIAGIAYGAKFGVGLMIGTQAGVDIGAALIEQMRLQTNFDIVNHSWGYTQPFSSNQDAQGPQDVEFIKALSDSAANGRGGLGTIMVVSAGNGRQDSVTNGNGLRGPNSANDQSFENSRFVITVAAAERDGKISEYSDPGASLLITGFGGPGDGGPSNLNVFATDITGAAGYNDGTQQIANQAIDAAYSGFNGTSAAAPTVSGVIALMLEARPTLGWRDVKEILALSASHTGSAIGAAPSGSELYAWKVNKGDNWNGGGLHVSEDYGFGLINARNAVRLAESWTGTQRSNNEVTATASATGLGITVPDGSATGSQIALNVTSNIRVETAEVKLTFNAERARDLRLDLVSPNGTVATLIKDLGDSVTNNVNQAITYSGAFTFSATTFMEEKSQGTWTVRVFDTVLDKALSVSAAALTLYGEALTADDTYVYNDEFGLMRGLASGAARATLTDANGGTDTINAAQLSTAATINLGAGATSTLGGSTFQIAANSVIENALGGDGNDTITGNAIANLLRGNRGNDILNGGDGTDTAVYKGAKADYTITRNADGSYTVADKTANRDGTDTLTQIEQLQFADQTFALSTDLPFPALFAANLSQAKAISSIYQILLGGTPAIAGYDFLIKGNLSTNFGAGAGAVFNDENIFINVANALVQGNATATAKFNTLAAGTTLSEKITSLYSKIIPAAKQTAEGVAFLTRPDGLKFYQDVAKERGITAENGPAVIALASLLKVAVDGKIGVGNAVSDLIASVADGSSELPATSTAVLPIETIDGTKFDADDAPDVAATSPPPLPLIGVIIDEAHAYA